MLLSIRIGRVSAKVRTLPAPTSFFAGWIYLRRTHPTMPWTTKNLQASSYARFKYLLTFLLPALLDFYSNYEGCCAGTDWTTLPGPSSNGRLVSSARGGDEPDRGDSASVCLTQGKGKGSPGSVTKLESYVVSYHVLRGTIVCRGIRVKISKAGCN